jgi:TatD DNase family protein
MAARTFSSAHPRLATESQAFDYSYQSRRRRHDTYLREEGAGTADGGVAGVMHCFTESLEVALAAIEMGFYISFSGILTFKSAKDLQAVAKALPLDRILIETDSPYLAPMPHRGKMNEPGFVRHVGEFLADLKGVSVTEVQETTTKNFFKLFQFAH